MVDVLLAAGSNLGDRRAALDHAVTRLAQRAGIRIVAVSRWIETPPVGGAPGQQPFLNGAIRIDTELDPERLLDVLQEVEQSLGRQRGEIWGPRTIDLDLLLYGRQTLRSDRLIVPHPRMTFRRFVLAPALETAADMLHPEIGWTVAQIVQHLDHAANYVAIGGPPGAGQTSLASATCAALAAQCIRAEPSWSDQASAASLAGDRPCDGLGWLREHDRRLRDANWNATQGQQPPLISDYWLDGWVAEASVWLAPAEAERVEHAWRQLAAQCVRPKLVVLLDASADVLLANLRRQSDAAIDFKQLEQSRAALRQLADQGGHGPLLRLDARDPEQMLNETCAAITAMRPLELP